jgi:hypothetical protein
MRPLTTGPRIGGTQRQGQLRRRSLRSEEPEERLETRARTVAEVPPDTFDLQVPKLIVLPESYGSFNIKKRS